jgi:hypothetical protein
MEYSQHSTVRAMRGSYITLPKILFHCPYDTTSSPSASST